MLPFASFDICFRRECTIEGRSFWDVFRGCLCRKSASTQAIFRAFGKIPE